ncbi:MAG: hypothetical protein A2X46_16135 [Lentisphaerae bacterium GWF2_57_35]|nr:MAG: hypothetical protein A2X46_16135 [Lentisphaerae bacterium GWF2_57_35]
MPTPDLVSVQAPAAGQGPGFQWTSRNGYEYVIMTSTNLFKGFYPLQSNIVATPSLNSFVSPITHAAQRFYFISEYHP